MLPWIHPIPGLEVDHAATGFPNSVFIPVRGQSLSPPNIFVWHWSKPELISLLSTALGSTASCPLRAPQDSLSGDSKTILIATSQGRWEGSDLCQGVLMMLGIGSCEWVDF